MKEHLTSLLTEYSAVFTKATFSRFDLCFREQSLYEEILQNPYELFKYQNEAHYNEQM